jgi:ABC-2 type transport system permease protein
VATKISATMIITLPVILVVELTGMGLGGVRLGLGTWAALSVMLWAGALPFAALGVLVGFVASSETAYPLVTALMFLLSFFGGLFTPVGALPAVLREVANFLPSYHNAALGWSLVAGHPPGIGDAAILLGYTALLGLAVTWRHRVEESRAFA